MKPVITEVSPLVYRHNTKHPWGRTAGNKQVAAVHLPFCGMLDTGGYLSLYWFWRSTNWISCWDKKQEKTSRMSAGLMFKGREDLITPVSQSDYILSILLAGSLTSFAVESIGVCFFYGSIAQALLLTMHIRFEATWQVWMHLNHTGKPRWILHSLYNRYFKLHRSGCLLPG